jgi:hypothetical protein
MVAFSDDKSGFEDIGRAERRLGLPKLTLSFIYLIATPLHLTP